MALSHVLYHRGRVTARGGRSRRRDMDHTCPCCKHRYRGQAGWDMDFNDIIYDTAADGVIGVCQPCYDLIMPRVRAAITEIVAAARTMRALEPKEAL